MIHLILESNQHSHEPNDDAVPVHLRSTLKNCLRLFFSSGAGVEKRDLLGNSPVAYALVEGHNQIVPMLFDLANPKNSNLFDQVNYQLQKPPKPDCQESDYDEWRHNMDDEFEIGEKMSAAEKANAKIVQRWKKEMSVYRRRQNAYSKFKNNMGVCALHFFATQGKLDLVHPPSTVHCFLSCFGCVANIAYRFVR